MPLSCVVVLVLDADSGALPTRDMAWHEHLQEHWDQAAVETSLLPFDADVHESALGVAGKFNADDTFRFAITLLDREEVHIFPLSLRLYVPFLN